jgi:SCY1-like protein 2
VWTFDKRSTEIDRLSPMARDKTMDVLKAEVRGMLSGTEDDLLMNINA